MKTKRFGAVVAGLIFTFVVTTIVDVILHSTGVYPPLGEVMSDRLFVLATSYRLVFNTLGCYVAARLAPDMPMKHAVSLGILGTIISTAGAIAMWDQGPAWYSLILIFTSLPCAWLGGKLYLKRTAHA